MLPAEPKKEKPPEARPADACPLCYGFYESGPRAGERYPLCLACREEAARLAGVADPRMLNRAWTTSAVAVEA